MIDKANSSNGIDTPWYQRGLPLFFSTWAACLLLFFTLIMAPSQSLLLSSLGLVFGELVLSSVFASVGFLIWGAIPLIALLALTRKCRRCRPWIIGAVLFAGAAGISFHEFGPVREKQRFEVLTHMRWDSADCLMAKRAEAMGDGSLYFWAFRGLPRQFNEHLSQLPWKDQLDQSSYFDNADSLASKKAYEVFGSNWKHTKTYYYMNDRRENNRPFGNSVMAVDASKQHWAIFWISQ